ncbi:MAG: response regulator transcription factor [Flavobacteriales bacterium]|nr:response regulator transcription factor [Flavobacteriales bacterium]
MKTILIADDHSFIGEAIELFIGEDQYIVIGKAEDGDVALSMIKDVTPDVLITDIAMPKSNGLELISEVKKLDVNTKIIVFSMHVSDGVVLEALELGASAYLSKKTGPGELIVALNTILEGGIYLSKDVSDVLVEAQVKSIRKEEGRNLSVLSDRETEVVRYIAKGLTSGEIGEILFISARTVDTHRNNILKKLDVKNSAELVSLAYENHLIHVSSENISFNSSQ